MSHPCVCQLQKWQLATSTHLKCKHSYRFAVLCCPVMCYAVLRCALFHFAMYMRCELGEILMKIRNHAFKKLLNDDAQLIWFPIIFDWLQFNWRRSLFQHKSTTNELTLSTTAMPVFIIQRLSQQNFLVQIFLFSLKATKCHRLGLVIGIFYNFYI